MSFYNLHKVLFALVFAAFMCTDSAIQFFHNITCFCQDYEEKNASKAFYEYITW